VNRGKPAIRQESIPGTHRVLAMLFLFAVVATVVYTHQLVIPLFLGLLAWGKLWLKTLTPKVGMLLLKNSVVLQLRRFAVQASTHIFVKSHKPWRRFLTRLKLAVVAAVSGVFNGYLGLPLWLRTAIAIGVLIATAGSSFAVFALLIIPQTLLDWMGRRLGMILNRLGVTRFLVTLWEILVPETLRHRWYMYVKWKLGRQQLRAARRVHEKVVQAPTVEEQSETTINLPEDSYAPK